MSIEREVPKDISRYESKLLGPFTTRQIVCGVPGIALAIGGYFISQPYVNDDISFFIAFIIGMPFLLCGWAKPYGIPLEKYLSIIFVSQVLAPKHRKYVTENTYKDIEEKKEMPKKEKKHDDKCQRHL